MQADFIRDDVVIRAIPKSALFTDTNLRRLGEKLDCDDLVSLLYLMCDDDESNKKMYEVLTEVDILGGVCYEAQFLKLCSNYIKDWDKKIIEALVEIECFEALLEIFHVNKLDAVFNVTTSDRVLNPNKVKILKVCEGLDRVHKEIFLRAIGDIIGKDKMPYPLDRHRRLEMCFMHWDMIGEIKPTGQGFENLVKALEVTGLDSLLDIVLPPEHSHRLTKDDYTLDVYPIIDENEVGLCLIVNQFDFEEPKNNRAASCMDEKCLKAVMDSLHFKVEVLHNLASSDIGPTIRKTINTHFKKTHSMLFLTIMSHGHEDAKIMGTDGKFVSIEEIAKPLYEANALNRKPKVLVICACRGDSFFTAHNTRTYEIDGPPRPVPIRSDIMDIITCYSTISGFVSIRNVERGTFFIQALCEVLEKRSDLDIYEIFTLLNKVLMYPKDFRLYNPKKLAHPCEFNSRLLKKLYLKKVG